MKAEEDGVRDDLIGHLGDLGQIDVRCHWFRKEIAPNSTTPAWEIAVAQLPSKTLRPLLEDDTIPERNLKGSAISHQAK